MTPLGCPNALVSWAELTVPSGVTAVLAALMGWALAPFLGGYLRAPLHAKAVLAVSYLALFGSVLAFSAYIYLAKAWPPAKMGTYAYLNPLVAVLLGTLVLKEPFGWRALAGMLIILAAVALVQLRSKPILLEVLPEAP